MSLSRLRVGYGTLWHIHALALVDVLLFGRARVVKLFVPNTNLHERTVTWNKQSVQARAFVGPNFKVLGKCQATGLLVLTGCNQIGCGDF
jgi:hypothetical protein